MKFVITENWLIIYNNDRPHQSLAGLSPSVFAAKRSALMAGKEAENSTLNQF